jgi:hypothetical protein
MKHPYDPLNLSPSLTLKAKSTMMPSSSRNLETYEDDQGEDSDVGRFVIVEPAKKTKAAHRKARRSPASKDTAAPINLTGFICTACGRIFPSNNGRNEHMRSCGNVNHSNTDASEGDMVLCPYPKCSRNKTTFQRNLLYKHVHTAHPEKKNPSQELDELIRMADIRRREGRSSKSTMNVSSGIQMPTFSGLSVRRTDT